MNNMMKKYQQKGWKALTMLLAVCFVLAGMTALTACSSTEDPYYTVSEDDAPRILNTDLTDQTIDRKTPLNIEIKVTPMQYTTVTWLLNDVKIAEGFTINQLVPVGDYTLKILATTVKGKTTSRTIRVNVMPADDDPKLATDGKSRWLTIGTTKTIACENVTTISKLFIGDVEATNVSYADNQITFDIPSMPEGNYQVVLVDGEGTSFGCGMFTVSNEEYPNPAEKVIYTGPSEKLAWSAITWGKEDIPSLGIKPGMIITVYVTADEGAEGAIATSWWNDINSGVKWDAEGGCKQSLPQGESVMTYTVTTTQYLEEQGLGVVGNNFVVEKITIEEPAETVIYEGPSEKLAWNAITWGKEDIPSLGIKVGTVITVYYVADAGAAGAIATSWWNDINSGVKWDAEGGCRQDLPEGEGKMEYEVTNLDYLNEQGLGVVGNAYVIEKVTIK